MTTRRVPRNTSREVNAHPGIFLAEAMATGNASAAIEAQEAQGQQSFVASETLPTDMPPQDKKILQRAGVKFLGPVNGDPIFQHVELPAGWKKVPTDHSMWSDLVDDRGRKRGSIFYKAAFYDRSAHMGVSRRFRVERDYESEKRDLAMARVMDGDQPIFTTSAFEMPADDGTPDRYRERRTIAGQAVQQAVDWLQQKYPQHEDPGAYWD